MGFCWNCGRFNVHHPRCKNNTDNLPANPVFQNTPIPQQASLGEDPLEPPISKQRCVRTCLTIWVSIFCACGLIAIILSIVFASQIRGTLSPFQRKQLQDAALACGVVGAVLAVVGIVLSITWCSAFCCCKKRWICACCR